MKKFIVAILLAVAILALGFFVKDLFFSNLAKVEKQVSDLLEQADKKIFLPSPLIAEQDGSGSFLNSKEIIKYTNIEREKNGLAPLKENSLLDYSAGLKVEDMFKNQYFEHESPIGENVSNLAQRASYEYIVLGENLAMGNFEGDQDLVRAWMDSPGHRENILNSNFSEIGVYVMQGLFEGKKVWMAVQHFALPLSACPKADKSLKAVIENNQAKIIQLEQVLNSMKDNLKTRKDVKEYNDLVAQHNDLVDQNKALIQKYNRQIQTFNQCLAGAV